MELENVKRMALPKVYEGTWDELAARAEEFRRYPALTLIVTAQRPLFQSRYRADLTPEERIQAMDAAAEKNRSLPVLSPGAFDRESLYAEEGEFS
jgi:hypothetical protein